jgi:hypothetical protein
VPGRSGPGTWQACWAARDSMTRTTPYSGPRAGQGTKRRIAAEAKFLAIRGRRLTIAGHDGGGLSTARVRAKMARQAQFPALYAAKRWTRL